MELDARPWAMRRKFVYLSGVAAFFLFVGLLVYVGFFYQAPTCTDGRDNGDETGIDCGGSCPRVCMAVVEPPVVRWARSFRVTEGVYNAVAYVENRNIGIGAEDIPYTFSLFDDRGEVITTVMGTTTLPPGNVYAMFEDRINVGDQIPVKTTLTFDTNVPWTKMESGKEQFYVQSKEITRADLRPRLDAIILNKSLDEAKDVEAIATIFDAKGNPLTASRTFVPIFPAETEQKVTFTWPEPIAKTVRSCVVPTDVVLAIDLSGSINDDGGTPPEPLETVLRAASGFAKRLKESDQASIVTFATEAFIREPLSTDRERIAEVVRKLSVEPKEERGSTNTGDGLRASIVELLSERHNPDARKVVVLLTDGKANAPEIDDMNPEIYAQMMADEAYARGVEVYTIGLGSNVNAEFLATLATTEKHAYTAVSKESLDEIYRTISLALCEDGPAIIDIITKIDESR
jgi:Mg-chelatase subunit ChlD